MKQLITRYFTICLIFFCSLSVLSAQNKDSTLVLEVNFDLDSSTLSRKQKDKVDSLLAIIPIPVYKQIEVYGHTDSLAGIEYNRELSKRRVSSILQYLVLQGLDPLKVKADYYGEERPKYDNSPESRAKNRRCEVHFHVDPGALPMPNLKLTDLEYKTGNRVRIPNLNFVGNQPIPIGDSFETLKELLRVMQKYPDLKIQLQGHVCCNDNMELSTDRAKMVHDFLVGNGIDASRMTYKGFSNKKPMFKETSDENKAMNRRVEIFVLRNTDRVVPLPADEPQVDLRAPVLAVTFFPNKRRLYPSGDFMLNLIADMMKESSGLYYEFVIFDNINDSKLTSMRVGGFERALLDFKVEKSKFSVTSQSKYPNMPSSVNNNLIMVKISKR